MKRRISWGMALLIMAGIACSALLPPADAQQRQADVQGPIELKLCRINTLKQVDVTFDRLGVLSLVEPSSVGSYVEKGQVVARLKSDIAVKNLEVATRKADNEVEIKYAQAAFAVSDVELQQKVTANEDFLKRNAKSDRRKILPYSEMEIDRLNLERRRAQLQIEKAGNDMEIAQLEKEQAEVELDQYHVKSEHSGMVTTVHKHVGEAVRQGDPVLTLTDLENVEAIGRITASDYRYVQQGDPVVVIIDIPKVDLEMEKRKFEGRIVAWGDEWDALHTTLDVIVKVKNQRDDFGKHLLREGMPVRMMIYPRGPGAAPALSKTE